MYVLLVLVACSVKILAQKEGDLRLVGGEYSNQGNVLIYHKQKWGLICDDMWDRREAKVVCRKLGFKGADRATHKNKFKHLGEVTPKFWLDNLYCRGFEKELTNCRHLEWGIHNCQFREAAGVVCTADNPILLTTTTTTTTQRPTTTTTPDPDNLQFFNDTNTTNDTRKVKITRPLQQDGSPSARDFSEQVEKYQMRIQGGRNPLEGRLEIYVGGRWGVICGTKWGMMEAMVACKQLGLSYAKYNTKISYFGGDSKDKIFGEIKCTGREKNIYQCQHHEFLQGEGNDVKCERTNHVAGIMCTKVLPDLSLNITMLKEHIRLEDLTLQQLACSMEENCVSSSAYKIKRTSRDWMYNYRRLLRFSSNVFNNGTAPFEPLEPRERWEWHQCHMHYHSMSVFTHYDILDEHGNRVAEGHKASFCLEDVHCEKGREKYYSCQGGTQGISVGCSDIYMHDIDCQWIDVTDVPASDHYRLRIHINPENLVAEISYDDNVVTCDMVYTGFSVTLSNCYLSGPHTLQ